MNDKNSKRLEELRSKKIDGTMDQEEQDEYNELVIASKKEENQTEGGE